MADTSGIILIEGLTTPARWVDYFIVEVYPTTVPIGTPGTRITAGTSKVRWEQQPTGSQYPFLHVQQDLIVLKGLTTGQQYNLRSGVVAPLSGMTTWLGAQTGVTAIPGGSGNGNNVGMCCNCIDVRAYGAVGDGVTDDTAAVQAALNVASANAGSAVSATNSSVAQITGDIGTIVCVPSGVKCLVKANHLDACTGNGYGPCYVALYIDSGVTLRVDGSVIIGGGAGTDHPWVAVENRNAFIGSDSRVELDGIGNIASNTVGGTNLGGHLIRHTNWTGGVEPDNGPDNVDSNFSEIAVHPTTNIVYFFLTYGASWPTQGHVRKFDMRTGDYLGDIGTFDFIGQAGSRPGGGMYILQHPTYGDYLVMSCGTVWGGAFQCMRISPGHEGVLTNSFTPLDDGIHAGFNSGGIDVDQAGNIWLFAQSYDPSIAAVGPPTLVKYHFSSPTTVVSDPGLNFAVLHGWTQAAGVRYDPHTGHLILWGQDASHNNIVARVDQTNNCTIVTSATSTLAAGGPPINMGADGTYVIPNGLNALVKCETTGLTVLQTVNLVAGYGITSSIWSIWYDSVHSFAWINFQGFHTLAVCDLNNVTPSGHFYFTDNALTAVDSPLTPTDVSGAFGGVATTADGTRAVTSMAYGGTLGYIDFWTPFGGGQQGTIGYRFDSCARSRVRDLTFLNLTLAGGEWSNSEGPELLDTYFKGLVTNAGYGFLFDRCTDGIVRNNYIDGTDSDGLIGIADYANQSMLIAGNVLASVDFQSLLHSNVGFETQAAAATPFYADILFTDNLCTGGGGCALTGATDRGVRFEGNVLRGLTGTGLLIGGLQDSSIADNTIENGAVGLGANGSVLTNVSILNNNVQGNSTADIVMPWTSGGSSPLNSNAANTVVMWNPAIDTQIYTSFATRSSITEGVTGTKAGKAFPLSGPANMAYQIRGGSPLTQSGTAKSIVIAPFIVDFPDKAVSYAGATIPVTTDHGYTTYYVFVDDTWHDGTTDVSYGTTVTQSELATSQGRISLGTITLLAAGGGVGTTSNNNLKYSVVGVTLDGGSSSPTTGTKGYIQVPYSGTIVGWSVIADQAGALTVEVDKKASSAPPAAPAIPNTTTDKISASAPITTGGQQSASGGATAVSTWTTTVAQWDVFQFNVTVASTLLRATICVVIQRT